MGYSADILYSSVVIPHDQQDACRDAIINLWPQGAITPVNTLSDALFNMGFETTETDDGLKIESYIDATYRDDTDTVLEVIAPFVQDKSSIMFVGEDMTVWVFLYNNKNVYVFNNIKPEGIVNLAWHRDEHPAP